MRQVVKRAIKKAFHAIAVEHGFDETKTGSFDISTPKEDKFGHFSANLAMIKAKALKRNPRELADMLASKLLENGLLETAETAGPGFINMRIKPDHWVTAMNQIFTAGKCYGNVQIGNGEKIMVEFVSANPTGPLHIGHGRGAVVGDALARVLSYAGYDVYTEYYINDVGLQMDNLGYSTIERLKELNGEALEEDPPYRGDYIKDIAKDYKNERGSSFENLDGEEALKDAREYTSQKILAGIKTDLDDFRIGFNEWFSEAQLHDNGQVDQTIEKLVTDKQIYDKEGALWIKTEAQGDEKDRVVKRANGITTYLAADIAYHKSKFDRGFKKLVNIWGADHHGYVARMRAVVAALGQEPDDMIVRLVQLVSLKKGGKTLAMSTREGVFTTLREIMDEVGVDATRYFFLMRSSDSHLEFDVDLAKKESSENPVFYIQYAHARCSNIFRTAKEQKLEQIAFSEIERQALYNYDEQKLIRKLLQFPDVVEACALAFHAHPITQYLTEVASLFHYFYRHNRVVTEDKDQTRARLWLVRATMITLNNGLNLLGINAPERM